MVMKRTGARKGRTVSALVRAEDAAEEEILETPALSSFGVAADDRNNEKSEDEDDEDEIERRLVTEAQAEAKNANHTSNGIYKSEALLALVKDWDTKPLPWVETLETCAMPLELESVHDDLKREVAFYNNTLSTVRLAKERLKTEGLAYKRPDDYFAEMLKSDVHMAKIKDKLLYEQKKITAVEERKKSQAHRRVAKEVQAEKIKERNQQKKDTLDAVKQWKKRKGNDTRGGLKDNEDTELDLIVSGTRKRVGSDRDGGSTKPRVNRARAAKNAKFGFGGKRRHAKSNTKVSTNDVSSFPGARKAHVKSLATAKGGQRAGKAQRANQRNKSRR